MDIHAPDKPIHSVKEGLVHILIVTIGILIALGLEGVREMVHDRRLVSEARTAFRAELIENKRKIDAEVANTRKVKGVLDRIVADFPELEKHPESVSARLNEIVPALYTLNNSAWEVALSTGALAHMEPDEAAQYGASAEAVRLYGDEQLRSLQTYTVVKSYVGSRLDPASMAVLEREVRVMNDYEFILVHGSEQTQEIIDHSLKTVR